MSNDSEIRKAIETHTKYLDSIQKTGTWIAGKGHEYIDARCNFFFEDEYQQKVDASMKRAINRIKKAMKE